MRTVAQGPLLFKANGRGFALKVPRQVCEEVLWISRGRLPNETGGMLVGTYDADLFVAIPQRAIESVDSGSAGISGFVRRPLDGLLARLWRWTAGRRYYLGEWHSHPGRAGTPSAADDETMFAIATDPLANCPEPILLLVSGTLHKVSEISAYVYTARGERIELAQAESLS